MIEALAVIIALGIIYLAGARMVQANRIFTRSVKEIQVLSSIPVELARNKKSLEKQISDITDQYNRGKNNIEKLKQEQETLIEELARLKARPKDGLYVMERTMQPGQPLWEVVVSNDSYFRSVGHADVKKSWIDGRHYLVSAPSDRDAQRRADLRFLSAQGYRIQKIQKSTRF